MRLFQRLPRGIRPTEEGELLLVAFRRWRREMHNLQDQLRAQRGGLRGTVRIAAAESVVETFLPGALAEFSGLHPLVDYRLISGDNHRITSELLSRDADLVLAFDAFNYDRAEVLARIETPIGLIAPPGHPLVGLPHVSVSDCAPHPFIIPGDDWLRHSGLRDLLDGGRPSPVRVVARAERPAMLKSLVRAGLGVSFLTRLGTERDVRSGELAWVPLAPGVLQASSVSLLVPPGRERGRAADALIEIVRRRMMAAGAEA